MIMEKKKYCNPLVEVVKITSCHLLDSSMSVLPPHPAKRWTEVF